MIRCEMPSGFITHSMKNLKNSQYVANVATASKKKKPYRLTVIGIASGVNLKRGRESEKIILLGQANYKKEARPY